MIDWQLIAPLTVAILLAISGYIYNHYSQLINDRRDAKLARVNAQLRHLYGPCYSFSIVTHKTWVEFREQYRPHVADYWDDPDTLNEKEKQAYRDYMVAVIQPYQIRVEAAILDYSDLIDEDEMPKVLQELAANIADSKSLYAAWMRSDFSTHKPNNPYPVEFDTYARKKYLELKSRQLELLGKN